MLPAGFTTDHNDGRIALLIGSVFVERLELMRDSGDLH